MSAKTVFILLAVFPFLFGAFGLPEDYNTEELTDEEAALLNEELENYDQLAKRIIPTNVPDTLGAKCCQYLKSKTFCHYADIKNVCQFTCGCFNTISDQSCMILNKGAKCGIPVIRKACRKTCQFCPWLSLLGTRGNPADSCKQILAQRRGAKSGTYFLKSGSSVYPVYCDLEQTVCGGKGWTLIMKMDGKKKTFHYGSKYWTNKQSYNAGAVGGGFNMNEIKLDSYQNFPFTKLCLGMKVGATTKWLPLNYKAQSLYSLIADGRYRKTTLTRNAWKSLITGSSLQRNCNKEGFNVLNMARIGIVGNQENDCKSPDSRLAFGGAGSGCGQQNSNSVGNEAACSPDNGNKHIRAFGYIMAQ